MMLLSTSERGETDLSERSSLNED